LTPILEVHEQLSGRRLDDITSRVSKTLCSLSFHYTA